MGTALRRVIKPFAVEVRSGGRKKTSGPQWPELEAQPDVKWPSLDDDHMEPAPPIAEKPIRRVLPALDVQAQPHVEPYREPHETSENMKSEFAPVESQVCPQQGDASEREAPAAMEPAIAASADEVALASVTPSKVSRISASMIQAVFGSTTAQAVSPTQKQRLERESFKRGERWKARLPASVHRAAKKRDRKPAV